MDQAARRTALDTLDDVSKWRLRRGGWDAIGPLLEDIRRSLAAGDRDAVLQAVAEMRRVGPHRILGMENAAMLPLPEQYRERLNQLVHDLSTPPQDSPPAGPDNDVTDIRTSG